MTARSPFAEAIVRELSLDEKASLTSGSGSWATKAIPRVEIPAVYMTDGPAGARGIAAPGIGPQTESICIPCGSALGATWNPDLVERLGEILGRETRRKGCHILLAPTVNLHRHPLAGRNFECYSEDPYLSGSIAAAYVRGAQSVGLATTVKHFAGNDSEFERMTIDVRIDERTLREVTLVPFEMAVREGGALGVMTAYNRLNGTYCGENEELIRILREEWGFEGIVVTDWFAGASTEGAVRAGLDLQMPAPDRFYGKRLADAVRAERVKEDAIDPIVTRLLSTFERIGAFDSPTPPNFVVPPIDDEVDRLVTRAAAAETMVLLRNDGALPLRADAVSGQRIAIVGPNAATPRIMGGGSAEVLPRRSPSPLDTLTTRLVASGAIVRAEKGCDIEKRVPPLAGAKLRNRDGGSGFTVDVYAGTEFAGEPIVTVERPDGRVMLMADEPLMSSRELSFRAIAHYVAETSGPHQLAMVQVGPSRVLLDGVVKIDGIADPPPRGDAFFGLGSQEVSTTVELNAGQEYTIGVEYVSGTNRQYSHGAQVGLRPVPTADLFDRAVAAAKDAAVTIVVVGTNDDWETEGNDRHTMALPGAQDELIRAVAAVNRRTIVVVNAGAPIAMPWVDEVSAVLQVWFGGEGMADALGDVVFGDVDPSGRLPTTFPSRLEDTPAFVNYPGEHGQVRYGEGLFVGYRWYDARKIVPTFAFGHGLSYADIVIENPMIAMSSIRAEELAQGSSVTVTVPVHNRGVRRGAEVVQCYVAAIDPRVQRPARELRRFEKVWLDAGERENIQLRFDARCFAYWDPADRYRSPHFATVSGELLHDELDLRGSWRIDPGTYEIHIGRSSADLPHVLRLTIE